VVCVAMFLALAAGRTCVSSSFFRSSAKGPAVFDVALVAYLSRST